MRAAFLTVILSGVLAASVLNLFLGALWVAALLGLILLRRRARFVVGFAFLLATGVGIVGIRLGWFTAPPPASYAVDEATWLLERLPLGRMLTAAPGSGTARHANPGAALRARLEERRREEFRYTAADFERRAAAAVALSRSVGHLRARAPTEAAELDEAVRRVALTLTSPEFRDLEGRRARLQTWFADLEARLSAARDEAEVESVARALDPASMAVVSLRAVREDLSRVELATTALVRALAGGDVSLAASAAEDYDEARGQLDVEVRYVFAVEPPLQISRLEVGGLRQTAPGQTLAYEAAGAPPRQLGGTSEVALPAGVARVVVVERRAHPVSKAPVRSVLKHIPFERVALDRDGPPPAEFLVTVALDGVGGLEALLPRAVPTPRLERVTAPRYALYFVSLPGTITTAEAHDLWTPGGPEGAAAWLSQPYIEVVPATLLFRNPVFARLKAYLYRPNPAAFLTLTGLAALTAVLVRRRRAPRPSTPP